MSVQRCSNVCLLIRGLGPSQPQPRQAARRTHPKLDLLARHYGQHPHSHWTKSNRSQPAATASCRAVSRSRPGTGIGCRPRQYGAVARSASVQQ